MQPHRRVRNFILTAIDENCVIEKLNKNSEDNHVECQSDVDVTVACAGQIERENIHVEPFVLPYSRTCTHCGAKKFCTESKGFCCCDGNVKLQLHNMPPELFYLFTSTSKEAIAFKNIVRSYNNHFAFTSFGVKYNRELCKNNKDCRPTYLQLYFYDTDNEIGNRLNTSDRLLSEVTDLESYRILLRCDSSLDQRTYNLPTSEQVAPLLFPYGEPKWHEGIEKVNVNVSRLRVCQNLIEINNLHSVEELLEIEDDVLKTRRKRMTVSCREYYYYKLQIRSEKNCLFLHTGRLLQQYVVDMYVKIEISRFYYFRNNQKFIRAEVYQGIIDSIQNGENRGYKIGRSLVLPTDFIGGPRYMRKRYMDAMSLVQRYGKPDVFFTMICNPNCPEIKRELRHSDEIQNRPDLLVRIFRAKLEQLKIDLIKRKLLALIAAYVYVIEFQKK
ncbi:uncharacterized protein LOC111391913 [Olea europaea var. sylvestris]|uniref:uncharacterized protein LOC111391913 n=1 Tax=Olea europaea var. sylvestris TaxID=158386 RepID=UPI000C1D171E|nr:uncharacterized protein LOC111391913 [Olea europaea var. sylvestris]